MQEGPTELPRLKATVGNTVLEGPVDNQRCPACANSDSIYKETDHHPETPGEIVLRSSFLLIHLLSFLIPRRTVRMRCAQCDCRFPARLSGAMRFVVALGILAALAAASFAAWNFRAYLMYWLTTQWQANPVFLITIASVLVTGALLCLLVALYPSPKRRNGLTRDTQRR